MFALRSSADLTEAGHSVRIAQDPSLKILYMLADLENMRKVAQFLLSALGVLVFAIPTPAMQLLSLQDFPLGPNEYVWAFKIDTWGVYTRVVCHIPFGWKISAGVNGTPADSLRGQAGHGANALNTGSLGQGDVTNVKQLKELFLIEDLDQVEDARPGHPATFSGKIQIGIYGSDFEPVWRKLPPSAYKLMPARACPDVGSFPY